MSEDLDSRISNGDLRRLRNNEQRYKSLMRDLKECVYITSDEGFKFINRAGVELFGYGSFEEMLLMHPEELYVDPEERDRINAQVEMIGFVRDYELRLKRKDGTVILVEDTVHMHLGEQGDLEYRGVMRDITKRKLDEAKLMYQATHDTLTGLFNRQAFFDYFTTEISRQWESRTPSHLMFIDINDFKEVNDTQGHIAGDKILRDASRLLMDNFRGDYDPPTRHSITNGNHSGKKDFLARTGGDEFVILPHIPECSDAIAAKIASETYAMMKERGISLSIGISKFPDNASDADDPSEAADLMYHRADVAMYHAKSQHKNGNPVPFAFFDESMAA